MGAVDVAANDSSFKLKVISWHAKCLGKRQETLLKMLDDVTKVLKNVACFSLDRLAWWLWAWHGGSGLGINQPSAGVVRPPMPSLATSCFP